MWDPPGPRLQPVSPPLAGGCPTTAPPGKALLFSLKKEILTHVTTWMDHEDVMLSETHESQKDKYSMIPLRGLYTEQSHS